MSDEQKNRKRLLILVLIILLAIGINSWLKKLDQHNKQQEACMVLSDIYASEENFRIENDSNYYITIDETIFSPGDTIKKLGVVIPIESLYKFKMFSVTSGFVVEATANLDDDPTIDTWVMASIVYAIRGAENVINDIED